MAIAFILPSSSIAQIEKEQFITQILLKYIKEYPHHSYIIFSKKVLTLPSSIQQIPLYKERKNSLKLSLRNTITIYRKIKKNAIIKIICFDKPFFFSVREAYIVFTNHTTHKIFEKKNVLKHYSLLFLNLIPPLHVNQNYKVLWVMQYKEQTIAYTIGRDIMSKKPYFLILDEQFNTASFIIILKAFSLLKKWQQTDIHLAIYTQNNVHLKEIELTLKNYKYRSSIIVCKHYKGLPIEIWIQHCYASIFIKEINISFLRIMLCIYFKIPIIHTKYDYEDNYINNIISHSIQHTDINLIYETMLALYKNEYIHSSYINEHPSNFLTLTKFLQSFNEWIEKN